MSTGRPSGVAEFGCTVSSNEKRLLSNICHVLRDSRTLQALCRVPMSGCVRPSWHGVNTAVASASASHKAPLRRHHVNERIQTSKQFEQHTCSMRAPLGLGLSPRRLRGRIPVLESTATATPSACTADTATHPRSTTHAEQLVAFLHRGCTCLGGMP